MTAMDAAKPARIAVMGGAYGNLSALRACLALRRRVEGLSRRRHRLLRPQ
jgi:hypothetical protein